MSTRIAINGFGRIGRMCMRASLERSDIEVVAINGTTDATALAHLLKYDSVHGKLPFRVEAEGNALSINGHTIPVLSERNPANLPWGRLGADIVIEATGKFNSSEEAKAHLDSGAKKVILTAPAKDDGRTIVVGVNEDAYQPDVDHIVSNASCTTNCLAPIVKVIHERFGIVSGLMSTVHAFTTDQRSLDNSHKDPRRGRSCTQSIVPTATGAAKAIGLVIPDLKGKLNGIAIRVPVPNVSLADLVIELSQDVTTESINQALQTAAQGKLEGVLEYCEEPLVSVDFLNNSHSAIVDALSTMVMGKRTVKILAWYDNEWGYSCRVIDLAKLMGEQLALSGKSRQMNRVAV
ncbi:glyceraldehyde-3-phosphate dehydrogenase [Anaerosporomusa subterranea]|uniref:Glyceraldehyde-3-phosphate dehydrogenase n=1 Tax=Anaerosporomusa subterranea TaxID=1794912 RepID=A0A154BW24_ANASB|nr:type I glyceraldehyde-3-phosphate dehydrogenase [Anaerosporomusa subterranea]KYZ78139.1 glyceraldehyde-3-phosphate dehydrogenase [Anaerosporomusa subterranea]